MVLSADKSCKNVDAYVLLCAKKTVDLLIKTRSQAGVQETTEFIFARFSANSSMSSSAELKEVVQCCPA